MRTPIEIHQKYATQGLVGYLLGATEFARQNLGLVNFSFFDFFRKDNSGDIVTEMDRCVHDSIVEYFRALRVRVAFLGEEKQSHDFNPQYALLVDEIEGTQNAVNRLPHGINMAIARYRPRLRVKDLEAAVVTNLYDGRIFVGERGRGAYKIQDGERKCMQIKPTDIYECPSPKAYTTDSDQERRQETLSEIFRIRLGNQPRSIDATGTRIVDLADGNIRAYGDWRNATKCWDVLPSALIVAESGFVFTDVLGFDFRDAIFYDVNNPYFAKDGGLNRRVGENFITASPTDHELLIYGPKREVKLRGLTTTCIWDAVINQSGEVPTDLAFLGGFGPLIWTERYNRAGRNFARLVGRIIHERQRAYTGLNPDNVYGLVNRISVTYLKTIPKAKHIADQSLIFGQELAQLSL